MFYLTIALICNRDKEDGPKGSNNAKEAKEKEIELQTHHDKPEHKNDNKKYEAAGEEMVINSQPQEEVKVDN